MVLVAVTEPAVPAVQSRLAGAVVAATRCAAPQLPFATARPVPARATVSLVAFEPTVREAE